MITRPWQEHRIGNPNIGACKMVWTIIDLGVRRPHQEWRWPSWTLLTRQDLSDLTCFLRQNEQYVWKGTAELRLCFDRLTRTLQESEQSAQYSRLAVLVNEVLLGLLDMFRNQEVPLKESLTSSEPLVRCSSLNWSTPWTRNGPWTAWRRAANGSDPVRALFPEGHEFNPRISSAG